MIILHKELLRIPRKIPIKINVNQFFEYFIKRLFYEC